MSGVRVALALETALDITAVRRLHDYGELDDSDVKRAFEQMRMQRFGHPDVPAYLLAVTHAACVLDNGGDINVIGVDAQSGEPELLDVLAKRLPSSASAVFTWSRGEFALLKTRAFIHDCVLGEALNYDGCICLAEIFEIDSCHASDAANAAEADITRLCGLPDIAGKPRGQQRAVAMAVNRYRLWLRWQASRGAITAGERAGRERALIKTEPTVIEPA